MVRFNLINNHLAVILPVVSLTMPFGLLVIKNYMDDIPNDIVEASVIDGCRHFTIYWRIVVPLSVPALAAVTNFRFSMHGMSSCCRWSRYGRMTCCR